MPLMGSTLDSQQLDRVGFTLGLAILVMVCLPLAIFPEQGSAAMLAVYKLIASRLGFLYLMAGGGALVVLGYLACGPFGSVKLGDTTPEFSDYSWAGMLFCAGVGAGLLFWAPVEWAYYYQSPPFDVEPRSALAASWASTYGIFHWGPTAWAFYCLPTLAIAYPYYTRRLSGPRFSDSCHYFLKARPDGPHWSHDRRAVYDCTARRCRIPVLVFLHP